MENQRDQNSPQESGKETASAVPTNVVGLTEAFTDPLWRTSVRLNPVEIDLLRTAPLRRLHFIAHAGASTISTLQSYSRLEHTLGVLALVSHFCPQDEHLRVAALLHDIGHLPMSHTFEGIAASNHHAIGLQLLQTDPIRTVLKKHAIHTESIIATLDGQTPSPLTNHSGLLNLDHLDSYVRSGRAAGRLDTDPAIILGQLALKDSAVTAPPETAAQLVDLICAEARLHTSWDNVGPVSVVRRLANQLLDNTALTSDQLTRMTDPELWSALDSCAATRKESAMIRYELHRLNVTVGHDPDHHSGWNFSLRKIYTSAPLVEGQPIEVTAPHLAAQLNALRSLPTHFHVRWN